MGGKPLTLVLRPLHSIARLGRNVILLGICQALGLAGLPMALLVGGIVGAELAPSAAWATLPIAVMVVGIAIATIPAALFMKLVGRKRGFLTGAAVSTLASVGAAWAISLHSFLLFCLALSVIGASSAFVQQYRFAAAESVEEQFTGRAVSFVLIGGIIAGLLGPQIGRNARDWLPAGAYSGSFVIIAVLYLLAVILLLWLRDVAIKENAGTSPARPLRTVVTQRTYLTAMWSSAVAFGVMGFIMVGAPVSMHVMDHFSLEETTLVIQGHVVAMYSPSLFTGFLVERLGLKRLQVLGIAGMGAGVAVAVSGHHFINYLVALVSLGLGWNFLFVAGTVMLTRSYFPGERFKAQGVNDFAVFGLQAAAVLFSGSVLSVANWEILNLASLPFLFFTLLLVLFVRLPGPEQALDS